MNNCCFERKIKYITSCEYKYFFNKANVIGIGFGCKQKNGFYTCQKCITVFVSKKLPSNQIFSQDLIPSIYKGILTDIVQMEVPMLCTLTKKVRPVVGGYSIGVDGLEAGSVGCLVADNEKDYILTCNHVVAGNSEESKNRVVVQPAPKYGGKVPNDVIGVVSKFNPVFVTSDDNESDAAIVETNRSLATIAIAYIGTISGINFVKLGEKVKKVGAITELTTGIIKTKYTTIILNFLGKQVTFKNQITTSKMSEKGDSGSMLLNEKNKALGMLVADNSTLSIFNDISCIIDDLEVHIVRH